jgi:hypothetical protein
MQAPTRSTLEEAGNAGFYTSERWQRARVDHRWARIQIRTVGELLATKPFEIPPRPVQFKQAERVQPLPVTASADLWSESALMGLDSSSDEVDDDEAE